MLYWLELGYTLTPVGRNTGIFVATRGNKSGVLTTNFFDEVTRSGSWYGSVAEATEEAVELVRERSGLVFS